MNEMIKSTKIPQLIVGQWTWSFGWSLHCSRPTAD